MSYNERVRTFVPATKQQPATKWFIPKIVKRMKQSHERNAKKKARRTKKTYSVQFCTMEAPR